MRDLVTHAVGGGWGKDETFESSVEVAVIRGADFPDVEVGQFDNLPVRWEAGRKVPQRTLLAGDIVLEISGGSTDRPTGRTVYISKRLVDQSPRPVIPASFCRLIRIDSEQADPSYVYWWLQGMFAEGRTWGYQNRSTGIANFQFEHFLDAEQVLLPPRREQRDIAATLGTLSDKIVSNRQIINLLEELGSALLQSQLEIDVYGFPSYGNERLGDQLSIVETGSRPKGGVAAGGGVVSLGAESIQSAGVLTTREFKAVPVEFAANMKRGRLQNEDVLVYKDGGRPGNFTPHVSAFGHGFPVDTATINEHVYRVRAKKGVSQALLYWLLRSPWMDQEMRKRGTGVAIPGLNSTNFKDLPIPDLANAAIEWLNFKLAPMFAEMLRAGAENRRLVTLRDNLLPALLSGRIRAVEVSDAVEEAIA